MVPSYRRLLRKIRKMSLVKNALDLPCGVLWPADNFQTDLEKDLQLLSVKHFLAAIRHVLFNAVFIVVFIFFYFSRIYKYKYKLISKLKKNI